MLMIHPNLEVIVPLHHPVQWLQIAGHELQQRALACPTAHAASSPKLQR